MHRRWIVALMLVLVAPPGALIAWGTTAHRVINRVAVLALPGDLPPFVKRQIDWIFSAGFADSAFNVIHSRSLQPDTTYNWKPL
jgi:hypothetical protein